MFIVLLKFAENKSQASEFMDGHNQWLNQGFTDGVFLVAGNLQPGLGGSVVVHGMSRAMLEKRVNDDPFVAQKVVGAEILEITPKKTDARLGFLLEDS